MVYFFIMLYHNNGSQEFMILFFIFIDVSNANLHSEKQAGLKISNGNNFKIFKTSNI